MQILFLCFFLMLNLVNIDLQAYERELSICAIFQNDAKYLPEWIEFHQKKGVERFYLYNNLSTDDYQQILSPYVKSGLVKLIEWPYSHNDGTEWNTVQCSAYMDCIKKIRHKDKWCAFLDSDEFLFAVDGSTLSTYLTNYSASGIMVDWIMYGTSNVERIPQGEKMLNHLVYRAPLNYEHHRIYKSIVRPEHVVNCRNPHHFDYAKNRYSVDENGTTKTPEQMTGISVNKLRINHYWTRDMDFFYNVKLARRSKWYNEYERTLRLASEMNAEYDPILADNL